jgi:predicted nucleotidyltransferase
MKSEQRMDIVKLVKQEVTKIDPAAEVILFGSRARGDFRKDSDWDFLVLLNGPLTQDLKSFIIDKLYDLELQTDSVISAIIHTKSEWEDRAVTPICQIIKKEGQRA